MHGPERVEESTAKHARELFERIGYARCELDRIELELTKLVERRQALQKHTEVVRAENETLELDLLQRLTRWQMLDDVNQRVENVMPQLRAVTGSLTYRLVAKMLAVVNRLRRAVLPGPRATD